MAAQGRFGSQACISRAGVKARLVNRGTYCNGLNDYYITSHSVPYSAGTSLQTGFSVHRVRAILTEVQVTSNTQSSALNRSQALISLIVEPLRVIGVGPIAP